MFLVLLALMGSLFAGDRGEIFGGAAAGAGVGAGAGVITGVLIGNAVFRSWPGHEDARDCEPCMAGFYFGASAGAVLGTPVGIAIFARKRPIPAKRPLLAAATVGGAALAVEYTGLALSRTEKHGDLGYNLLLGGMFASVPLPMLAAGLTLVPWAELDDDGGMAGVTLKY